MMKSAVTENRAAASGSAKSARWFDLCLPLGV
jgi:hypothetical protein